ncbi:MAG: hypothetical protein GW861_03030 [Deltaproteobacteria bacterium]|nr:hypothetical protein [Deltaproteobacteria bacterium]
MVLEDLKRYKPQKKVQTEQVAWPHQRMPGGEGDATLPGSDAVSAKGARIAERLYGNTGYFKLMSRKLFLHGPDAFYLYVLFAYCAEKC